MSLLRVTPHDGRDVVPPWRGHPKLGCHGKNHKVGAQVDGSGHYVCLLNGNQVPGVGRLHRGMDRGPNTTDDRRSRVLDDVLRWIADEEGCQRKASLCVTP